jgi:hypothetical protein
MNTSRLIDIVANLGSYDSEFTIYAVKPWTWDSDALVVREPEPGGSPREAESCGAEYFLEVFIAKEFLEDWMAAAGRATSHHEQCARLIRYAANDA